MLVTIVIMVAVAIPMCIATAVIEFRQKRKAELNSWRHQLNWWRQ